MKLNRKGISLLEMMVVIAIILLICTLAFPAIQSARDAGRRMQCCNNLWQIGTAMALYENTFHVFPPASLGCDRSCSTYQNGKRTLCKVCPPWKDQSLEGDLTRTTASAFVLILPFAEQKSLYDLAGMETTGLWRSPRFFKDLKSTWRTTHANAFITTRPAVYVCPSDPSEANLDGLGQGPALGSYAVCAGTKGPRPHRRPTSMKCFNTGMFLMAQPRSIPEVTDGLSNTFLVGEVQAADSAASRNIWSMAFAMRDTWRATENPLNTAPAIGRKPSPGVVCLPEGEPDCINGAFGSYHFWGANFLFADGHVTYVRDKIDMKVYNAFATIAGGEAITGKPTDIKK